MSRAVHRSSAALQRAACIVAKGCDFASLRSSPTGARRFSVPGDACPHSLTRPSSSMHGTHGKGFNTVLCRKVTEAGKTCRRLARRMTRCFHNCSVQRTSRILLFAATAPKSWGAGTLDFAARFGVAAAATRCVERKGTELSGVCRSAGRSCGGWSRCRRHSS